MKICTFGTWRLGDATPLSLHIVPFSWGQLRLSLGEGYGNPGLQIIVRFFFGWPFAIGVGRRTGLPEEDCLIQIGVLYVIKRMRQSSIC